MTILRYEPWALRLFNTPSTAAAESGGRPTGDRPTGGRPTGAWLPASDIYEEAAQYLIHIDLPGVDPATVEITSEQGVLTVRGKRDLQRPENPEGYRRVERLSGEFQRRFSLPETADAQNIKARATNGVLEIAIPKLAQVQPRKILIEAA
jgi:HSP20 family protein